MNNFLISSSHTIEFNVGVGELEYRQQRTPVVRELREKWGYFTFIAAVRKNAKTSMPVCLLPSHSPIRESINGINYVDLIIAHWEKNRFGWFWHWTHYITHIFLLHRSCWRREEKREWLSLIDYSIKVFFNGNCSWKWKLEIILLIIWVVLVLRVHFNHSHFMPSSRNHFSFFLSLFNVVTWSLLAFYESFFLSADEVLLILIPVFVCTHKIKLWK